MAATKGLLEDIQPLAELRRGGTSFVYKVNSHIVVKRPRPGAHEYFVKENQIFDILARHSPCPELVVSFLRSNNYNFLELMPGFSITERLQHNLTKDKITTQVLSVQYLEPLPLRKTWMKALAEGVAWLESLGLAHGDIKPENVLVDYQDRIKLGDFDCTDFIGAEFEACIPPYGRILGSDAEAVGSRKGRAGKLGARTEQFALGSLFYYINYGVEVYDDQYFGKDHGPVVLERLQQMIFPKLDGDSVLDSIIDDCWHGRFKTVAALSEAITQRCDLSNYSSQAMPPEEFEERRTFCLQLVEEGVFNASSKVISMEGHYTTYV